MIDSIFRISIVLCFAEPSNDKVISGAVPIIIEAKISPRLKGTLKIYIVAVERKIRLRARKTMASFIAFIENVSNSLSFSLEVESKMINASARILTEVRKISGKLIR